MNKQTRALDVENEFEYLRLLAVSNYYIKLLNGSRKLVLLTLQRSRCCHLRKGILSIIFPTIFVHRDCISMTMNVYLYLSREKREKKLNPSLRIKMCYIVFDLDPCSKTIIEKCC